MNLEKTYEMAENPPPPLPWAEYEGRISKEWKDLLNSDGHKNEEAVFQVFLERHPSLVPMWHGAGGPTSFLPHLGSLITQPVLPDYNYKKPDFMWLTADSQRLHVVLIEIEAPGKPWFIQSGRPSSELTQAIDQLRDWRTWFDAGLNEERFQKFYHLESELLRRRKFQVEYVLIYGRENEANRDDEYARKRSNMEGVDEDFMTFDRLSMDSNAWQFWTIKGRPGDWEAVSVPPTTKLGPALAKQRAFIEGREKVIRENPLISEERAEFLIERLPYWDEWAKRQDKGTVYRGDWE